MLVSKTLPQDVAFLVFVPLRFAPGSSVLAPAASLSVHKPSADSAGKIRNKEFGANLCDKASEALQEQVFYVTSIPINKNK